MVSLTISFILLYVSYETYADRLSNDFDVSIIGGKPVSIREVPYQLEIRIGIEHQCGASIISPKWAISAAHCFPRSYDYSYYTIHAGTSKANSGITYEIAEVWIHPQYNNVSYDYDAALIQIKHQFDLNGKEIKSIPIADAAPAEDILAQTSGWGTTEHGTDSDQLLGVQVPIVANAICKAVYSNTDGTITDRMLCAGYLGKGGKDSCTGDSGGPLVVRNQLVGIVSWGVGCGQPNYPGVYTNINEHSIRRWIAYLTGI